MAAPKRGGNASRIPMDEVEAEQRYQLLPLTAAGPAKILDRLRSTLRCGRRLVEPRGFEPLTS